MRISEASKKFISKLSSDNKFKKLSTLITQDINKCKVDITNMVLRNNITLEGNWTHYELTDINVIYDEDILHVNELLTMYGLKSLLPELKGDDNALIVSYKFNLFDMYGGIMDMVNVFHITIKGSTDNDNINEWFLMSDH